MEFPNAHINEVTFERRTSEGRFSHLFRSTVFLKDWQVARMSMFRDNSEMISWFCPRIEGLLKPKPESHVLPQPTFSSISIWWKI